MKGNNLIVACVVSGVATSPFCAYRNHLSGLLSGGSFDEWFVVSLASGDGFQAFRFALITCAVFGFIVGLLVKLVFGPVDPRKEFELNLLRTPIAATVLFPAGITTILLIAHNHTLKAFETFVWPDSLYFNHLTLWTVVIAIVGAILTGLLDVLEQAFEKTPHRGQDGDSVLLASRHYCWAGAHGRNDRLWPMGRSHPWPKVRMPHCGRVDRHVRRRHCPDV